MDYRIIWVKAKHMLTSKCISAQKGFCQAHILINDHISYIKCVHVMNAFTG